MSVIIALSLVLGGLVVAWRAISKAGRQRRLLEAGIGSALASVGISANPPVSRRTNSILAEFARVETVPFVALLARLQPGHLPQSFNLVTSVRITSEIGFFPRIVFEVEKQPG